MKICSHAASLPRKSLGADEGSRSMFVEYDEGKKPVVCAVLIMPTYHVEKSIFRAIWTVSKMPAFEKIPDSKFVLTYKNLPSIRNLYMVKYSFLWVELVRKPAFLIAWIRYCRILKDFQHTLIQVFLVQNLVTKWLIAKARAEIAFSSQRGSTNEIQVRAIFRQKKIHFHRRKDTFPSLRTCF